MAIKFEYFDLKGLGELTRYILAYAGADYEDVRIAMDLWPSKKPQTPFGSMPVLTLENGNEYAQGTAIARFFANKYSLAGTTDEERLLADMIVENFRTDAWPLLLKIFLEKDDQKKLELSNDARPKVCDWLKRINDGYVKGTKSVLGSGISWADFALFNFVNDMLPAVNMKLDPELTRLQAVVDSVKAIPQISAWIEKRNDTPV